MEIKENGKKIIRNLAPLIGARPSDKRWNPRTARLVCKNLRIASLVCLDLNNDEVLEGKIKYKFKNKLSLQASNIHKLAIDYSPLVLNTNYIIQGINRGRDIEELKDLLFMQSLSKEINDSAIIDILERQKAIELIDINKYILFILLESFSTYYSLYEFCYENKEPDKMQLGNRRITDLANNIEYVKYRLSKINLNTIDLTHHLSTLLMNILAINYDINKYFIEN